jgi:hypothetical protein
MPRVNLALFAKAEIVSQDKIKKFEYGMFQSLFLPCNKTNLIVRCDIIYYSL